MQAIILAAGEGRRLRPLTAHRPKVMLPVGGRPLLEHVVTALVSQGVTDITMVVGYHKERIQTHFQDGDDHGCTIRYAHQERQLGTGHALATGYDAAAPDGPFLVLPGDNFVTPDLVRALIDAPGDAALVTTRSTTPSKYGVVETEKQRVVRIVEKPETPSSRLISTGIYRFTPEIRDYLEGTEGVALTDAVNTLVDDEHTVTTVPTEDAWEDIVHPWDLLSVNHRVLRRMDAPEVQGETEDTVTIRGPCRIGEGTVVRQGTQILGPVSIGDHCDIGPNVVIRGPASIGDHVHIGPFGDLENVVVHDNAVIDTGAILRHSIIDTGARLGPRVAADRGPAIYETDHEFTRIDSLGAVIGQDAFIGANVVLEPAAVIGTQASIAPNRTVHRVPDKAQVI